MDVIKLTKFSHGAGCGCKISPAVLETILHSDIAAPDFPNLLVGNATKDDAAVYDLENGNCLISTTDFFMPIVDDPYKFGGIASTNAISDVYAMGGKPIMAIAILGWPLDKLPANIAAMVLDGARAKCHEAGIPLAGGHSIDCPEPVFGLAVTGTVAKSHLKRNDTARKGSLLYLTKKLGVGIVTTAQKKGIVDGRHLQVAIDSMLTLNQLGADLAELNYVNALTDVTGFGLLGHLTEVCEGSGLSAEVDFSKVPMFDFLDPYLEQKAFPGGTNRNWESYGSKISPLTEKQRVILCDPQTSGGLLISVDETSQKDFELFLKWHDVDLVPFGRLVEKGNVVVRVR